MSNDKKGIDLIIDRVEALRVRISSIKDDLPERAMSHWEDLCVEAKTEAVKLGHNLDDITAALALPRDASGEDIALAVRQCTRHCEELEHKVLAFQELHALFG